VAVTGGDLNGQFAELSRQSLLAFADAGIAGRILYRLILPVAKATVYTKTLTRSFVALPSFYMGYSGRTIYSIRV